MVETTIESSRTDIPRPTTTSAAVAGAPWRHADEPARVRAARARDADVTELLRRWHAGEGQALEELLPWVYGHLHQLAESAMRSERRDHTLQATALVNEAYLRLQSYSPPDWRNRTHFFAVSARLMRRILVDHARAAKAARRGGGVSTVQLHDTLNGGEHCQLELLAIDEALNALSELRPRQAQVLEMRFFAGLSVAEAAEALSVSEQTVMLDTRLGRAWLYARLRFEPEVEGIPSPATH